MMGLGKQEIEDIAFAVAENLRTQHVIPGEIPSEIGQWIRELNHEHDWRATWVIPMGTYYTPRFDVTLLASGGVQIEFLGQNGRRVWQGTLLPVDRPHGEIGA